MDKYAFALSFFLLLHFKSTTANLNCTRPLTSNDTLCGFTNTSVLECHAKRVQCPINDIGSWISVCLFLPMGSKKIQQNFISNHDRYNCNVMGNFGSVNCTLQNDSTFTFESACNYTFYFCKKKKDICLNRFSRELEEGGSCPPPKDECPSENLFSLTNAFCSTLNTTVRKIEYTDLKKLLIRPPSRCTDRSTLIYAITFVALFLLFLLMIVFVLLYNYKKLNKRIKKSLAKDPVIEMTEMIFSEWEEFLKKEKVILTKENADPWHPQPKTPDQRNSLKERKRQNTKLLDNSVDLTNSLSVNQLPVNNKKDCTTVPSIGNPTYINQNNDNCNDYQDEDAKVLIVNSYTLKDNFNAITGARTSLSSQTSQDSFHAIPSYLKENFLSVENANDYLQKDQNFQNDVMPYENLPFSTTDTSLPPSYLRKNDLTKI